MPRKKKPAPVPLQTCVLEDGTVVEVFADDALFPGSGQHNVREYAQRRDRILNRVVDVYFPKGRKPVPLDHGFMASASKFDRTLQLWGLAPEETSIRKRLYPDTLKHLRALKAAHDSQR